MENEKETIDEQFDWLREQRPQYNNLAIKTKMKHLDAIQAELTRLRSENEHLREALNDMDGLIPAAKKEIEELRAENEALKETLNDATDMFSLIQKENENYVAILRAIRLLITDNIGTEQEIKGKGE